MFRYFTRNFIRGIMAGFAVSLIFGVFLFVRAVAPGATKNPSFGPQDDDVVIQPRLECIVVGPVGAPVCPPLFPTRTGCGGDANDDNNNIWGVDPNTCDTDGNSYAICCRLEI